MESFDGRDILLSLLGFLPFFVGFGYDHRTVHTELIDWIVDGNDASTFSFLLSHVLKRVGFDVDMTPFWTGWQERWRRRGRWR